MKRPRVLCSTCGGFGVVPLAAPLMETLSALAQRGPSSAAELHRASTNHRLGGSITPNAINNRLEDLRFLGLVSRERDGKRWVYTATKRTR